MPDGNQGNPPSGGQNGGQVPNANPFGNLSEADLKQLSGQLFPQFQSKLDAVTNDRDKLKTDYETLQNKFSKFENYPELEKKVQHAEALIFEAQAMAARNRIVAEKFPQLKGKESFIKLGTEDEMTKFAENLVKEFGLQPSGNNNAGGSPDIKAPAGGGQPQDMSNLLNALGNMSEDQLKETLQKLPTEELAKILGSSGGFKPSFSSPHSQKLASDKK